jgi:tetratricopeptide (TPR) repeat protein
MRAWPRGLRPTSLCASRRGVELSYRVPASEPAVDDRWFRVVASLELRHPSGMSVRGIPGPDGAALDRLVKAVELRLRRSPPARVWLSRARELVDALAHMRAFGGEGSESDAAIDELLACVAELRRETQALSPERCREIETILSRAGERLGAATVAELGVGLWLAGGAFERALDRFSRWREAIAAREDRGALACAAIMSSYLGRVAHAQEQAKRLAAQARDAIDARHAGELLEQLRRPELAVDLLRMAASDAGGDAGLFDAHRRLALAAAAAHDEALVRRAAAAMRAHAQHPDQLLAAAVMQREGGEFLAAEATLEQLLGEHPDAREAALLLASSRLWRGDHAGAAELAQQLVDADENDRAALRTLGAARDLGGAPEQALELLDRALAIDAGDDEARLWRAEVLDHLGRYQQARADVNAVSLGDLPAWQLLRALIEEHANPGLRIEQDTWFIVDTNIRQLLGDEAPADTGASHELAVATIRRAIDRLGGNRSTRLTTPTETEPVSLRWLDDVESPRRRAESLQLRATYLSVDEVLAEFAALAQAHPQVPFFTTYPAELLLWRGEYEEAFARFQKIWRATRTRWGYVGSGAAAMLLGRDEEALALWEEGKDYYRYIDAEATYCYRGELYRRRGELERALPDLELAVRARPARLGAWINLALLHHAAGREEQLREAVDHVEQLCPAFAWEARREVGLAGSLDAPAATLEPDTLAEWMSKLLELMCGNRSSGMYTIFDAERVLRVIPVAPAQLWREYGRRALSLFEDELLTELARRRGLG